MIQVPAAKIQFLPEDRPWIADRIQEVLASGQLTLGRYGAEFESAFARLCRVRHAVAVNSGTSALEIILRCLGVEGKKSFAENAHVRMGYNWRMSEPHAHQVLHALKEVLG